MPARKPSKATIAKRTAEWTRGFIAQDILKEQASISVMAYLYGVLLTAALVSKDDVLLKFYGVHRTAKDRKANEDKVQYCLDHILVNVLKVAEIAGEANEMAKSVLSPLPLILGLFDRKDIKKMSDFPEGSVHHAIAATKLGRFRKYLTDAAPFVRHVVENGDADCFSVSKDGVLSLKGKVCLSKTALDESPLSKDNMVRVSQSKGISTCTLSDIKASARSYWTDEERSAGKRTVAGAAAGQGDSFLDNIGKVHGQLDKRLGKGDTIADATENEREAIQALAIAMLQYMSAIDREDVSPNVAHRKVNAEPIRAAMKTFDSLAAENEAA